MEYVRSKHSVVSLPGNHQIGSIRERFSKPLHDRFKGLTAHEDGMAGRGLGKMLQIRWQVPGDIIFTTDYAVLCYGRDQCDHTGVPITIASWGS